MVPECMVWQVGVGGVKKGRGELQQALDMSNMTCL